MHGLMSIKTGFGPPEHIILLHFSVSRHSVLRRPTATVTEAQHQLIVLPSEQTSAEAQAVELFPCFNQHLIVPVHPDSYGMAQEPVGDTSTSLQVGGVL